MRFLILKGGAGSGFRGHRGRAGKRGGSVAARQVQFSVLRGDELGDHGTDSRARQRAALAYAKEHFHSGKNEHGQTMPKLVECPALGVAVGLSKSGVKHAVHAYIVSNVDHYRSLAAVPQLLQCSILLKSEPDHKRPTSGTRFHKLVAPLRIADKDYAALITVKQDRNGNLFYHHELTALREVSGRASRTFAPSGRPETIEMDDLLRPVKGREDLEKALAAGERWIIATPGRPDGVAWPGLRRRGPRYVIGLPAAVP